MTRAAAVFSILFEDPEAADALEACEIPDYFGDLNLDQVFDAVIVGRDEYRLAPFFGLPLSDERAVGYRQGVFHDLEAGLSEAVAAFAEQMRRVRSHLAAAGQRRHPYEKAAWFLDAGHIYCRAVNRLNGELARLDPASEGWSRCAAFLDSYVRSAVDVGEGGGRARDRVSTGHRQRGHVPADHQSWPVADQTEGGLRLTISSGVNCSRAVEIAQRCPKGSLNTP